MSADSGFDDSQSLASQVQLAHQDNTSLNIVGGGSKSFYGRHSQGETLDATRHHGIINYQPSELVITARAGTPLSDIESTLRKHKQMLGFEPPSFTENATLGGTIACNFSGPRRAYRGAARDYVLGSRIINGKGEIQQFGGEVMKNVAGYDVSRLMCGAMGTLGLILDVSLKVIPLPEVERSTALECRLEQALQNMHKWVQQGLPVSASAYVDGKLYIRLASNETSVQQAEKIIGGDLIDDNFWYQLKEQQLDFFDTEKPLWRLSLASTTPELKLAGDTLYEWGGALRWLRSDESADKIRHMVETAGGHAIFFKNNTQQLDPFHELSPGIQSLHRKLKQAFDPANILNPVRMYADI